MSSNQQQPPRYRIKNGRITEDARLPAGVLNIIIGSGSTVGDWLVTNPTVAMITFTGSHPVGKYIMSRGGLKKYTMELGSNSAVIICEDVDIDQAIPRSMFGSYDN